MTESNKLIQILLADLPVILANAVVTRIEAQKDMRVLGYANGPIELLRKAKEAKITTGVDVIILGTEVLHPPPGICSHILNEIPELKILVVSTRESTGIAYWLGIKQIVIQELSSEQLITEIRRLHFTTPEVE